MSDIENTGLHNLKKLQKIMIVEDEASIGHIVEYMLQYLDYDVTGLHIRGEEAIEKIDEEDPDLILMDISLRGHMDGIEAAQHIRENHDIPVVYMSGVNDQDTFERARITHPFGYIVKPVTERDIHSTIEMAHYRHQLEKRLFDSLNNLEQKVSERTEALEKANKRLENKISREKNLKEHIKQRLRLQGLISEVSAYFDLELDLYSAVEKTLKLLSSTLGASKIVMFIREDITKSRLVMYEYIDDPFISRIKVIDDITPGTKLCFNLCDYLKEIPIKERLYDLSSDITRLNERYFDDFQSGYFLRFPIDNITGGFIVLNKIDGNDYQLEIANSFLKVISEIIGAGLKRRIAEENLRNEKERLNTTISSMSDALISVNKLGFIELFNKEAENITGFKFDDVYGKYIDDVLNFDYDQEQTKVSLYFDDIKNLADRINLKKDIFVENKASDFVPVSVKISPIVNQVKFDGLVYILRDITSEIETERIKNDFISSISHELKTPLTSIQGFASTILRDISMSDEIREEFMGIILDQSQKLIGLVDDLLQYSHIESGDMNLHPQLIDATNILDDIVLENKEDIKAKSINLVLEFEKLPEILLDREKIYSALNNIVRNAVKFSNEKGTLVIKTYAENDEIHINIKDNGMGIPENEQNKIFDRFYRVHRPGKQIQGTGIGLAISKNIIEQHEGTITVSSELHKGSTFDIAFFKSKLEEKFSEPDFEYKKAI